MFSVRKTSTFAALLILAMPISNFCALKSETTTTVTEADSYAKEQKWFEDRMSVLQVSFAETVATPENDTQKRLFLEENLQKTVGDIQKMLRAKNFDGFFRYSQVQSKFDSALQTMINTCTKRLQEECEKENQDPKISINLQNLIASIKKQKAEFLESFKVFFEGQREASQTATPSRLALGQGFKADAETAASRINQKRPVKNPVVDPVAPQAARFQFTKKHWGIALIGIAALVGGMTVGQTKYKMFTRLFGRMPEKVVVPQLSWWGWFFKKAIFWR